jgi:hypothetical protein
LRSWAETLLNDGSGDSKFVVFVAPLAVPIPPFVVLVLAVLSDVSDSPMDALLNTLGTTNLPTDGRPVTDEEDAPATDTSVPSLWRLGLFFTTFLPSETLDNLSADA